MPPNSQRRSPRKTFNSARTVSLRRWTRKVLRTGSSKAVTKVKEESLPKLDEYDKHLELLGDRKHSKTDPDAVPAHEGGRAE